MSNKQLFFSFLLTLFIIQPIYGIERASFSVDKIVVQDWELKEIDLSFFDIQDPKQQFVLSSKQLSFPEPFSDIKLFDIRCQKFSWNANKIICQQGKGNIKSKIITTPPFSFSFSVTEKKSRFSIKNLNIAKGKFSILAKQKGDYWHIILKSRDLHLKDLQVYLKKFDFGIDETKGKMNANIEAKGKGGNLHQVLIKTLFDSVSLQENQGKVAMESVAFKLDLFVTKKRGGWFWENKNHITKGEIYVEPFYMEIKDRGLHINSHGMRDKKGGFNVEKFEFIYPDVMNINASAMVKSNIQYPIDSARIITTIDDLETFSTTYISPFLEQTDLEGIKLKGQLKSIINIAQSAVQNVVSEIISVDVVDDKQRVSIESATGKINWTNDQDSSLASVIKWDKINLFAIPIDAHRLNFLLHNKTIKLLKQSSLSLLGGSFDIKRFEWQHNTDDEVNVYFEGAVNNLSLEQLTQALDWTPLTGTISGNIPGVAYLDKTLSVDGELKVKVFDGIIKINQFSSSGIFTDFSKLQMNMEMENLDLHAITQKIKMGGIEGRLSGYMRNAYFENWRPVTFYAWMGTPDNDDSSHRISQKAVENIASIGGGGAADVISKGFLRFFDTFGYDRIGFGCYLYQGVCQLMGVEAAKQGYYIIKGGGLPRIDVVGFNPRVDWNVLVDRLSRLSDTDDVVIE